MQEKIGKFLDETPEPPNRRHSYSALRRRSVIRKAYDEEDGHDQKDGPVNRMKTHPGGKSSLQGAMRQEILKSNLNQRNARKRGAPEVWAPGEQSQNRERQDKPLKDADPASVIGPPIGVSYRGRASDEELNKQTDG
jgi:hypothetical protein